ncbi:hypothetical protein [Streptomyces sp. DH37]|uniref:hypothetical protein n=1 Tax=Streptomyces sp. DH37 TaxID=3040122 RepID=UPI002441E997|nr:hypothetical protein [Streptomyces sp. DH37]MDG9703861.1 hypothetical protein [Streptomyces sp. DH37]
MERKGFRYWVAPRVDADTAHAFTYRFVQDDVGWAREHGYGERLRQSFFKAKQRDPNIPYRNRLSPAERQRYLATLTGGPHARMLSVRLPTGASVRSQDGGCVHSARRQLYGDTEVFFHADKVATNLVPVYTPRLVRDPRFTKAVKAWSACVRKATGRAYADPAALHDDLNERSARLDAADAHRLEVALAVAEATCARRTSLTTTLRELDRHYGDPVRERYAQEISTSSRMRLAALRRADGMDHRH